MTSDKRVRLKRKARFKARELLLYSKERVNEDALQKEDIIECKCSDEPTLAHQMTDDKIIGYVLNSQEENNFDTNTEFDRNQKIFFNEGLEHGDKYLKFLE